MQTPQIIVPFAKMDGSGNQILVADLRGLTIDTLVERRAIFTLAQNQMTEFDQMMVIYDGSDYSLRIYNKDASPAGACGNGMRCVSRYIFETSRQRKITCLTTNGHLNCEYKDENNISVTMGQPKFSGPALGLRDGVYETQLMKLHPDLSPAFLVSMGNPHAIFFLEKLPDVTAFRALGAELEQHPIFIDRCNISFAQVLGPHEMELYSWERGAGLTQACGSAACASLVAAVKLGFCQEKAKIKCLGGRLEVSWTPGEDVKLIGPAAHHFYGEFDINTGEFEICLRK